MIELDALAIQAVLTSISVGTKITLEKMADDIYRMEVESPTHCTNCGKPLCLGEHTCSYTS